MPIYWIKKSDLPFNVELENSSNMFTYSPNKKVSNFFIPDSTFLYKYHYFNSLKINL